MQNTFISSTEMDHDDSECQNKNLSVEFEKTYCKKEHSSNKKIMIKQNKEAMYLSLPGLRQ